MLIEKELAAHFELLGTPPAGQERIRWIRENAPIRRVGGGSRATKVRFCSRKMGIVLEAEAYTTEYAALETFDADPDTLEIYTQPCKLRITYKNSSGKTVNADITPDIFRVTIKKFLFTECKTEQELTKLSEEIPDRYLRDSTGRWRSPPAETAASLVGCHFEIRSTADNNWTLVENLDFLKDYFDVPDSLRHEYERALPIIQARLCSTNWITVRELIDGAPPVAADAIYFLIVEKQIYFDLFSNRISDTDQALVFRDELSARAYRVAARTAVGLLTPGIASFEAVVGSRFSWDGQPWRVINASDTCITASRLGPDGKHFFADLNHEQITELCRTGRIVTVQDDSMSVSDAEEILRTTPPDKLRLAIYRYQILFTQPTTENPLVSRSRRAKAYWLASFRNAEGLYGIGLIGLIPDVEDRQGNHEAKLDPQARELAIKTIEELYESGKQTSKSLCHGDYINLCATRGVTPSSLRTFANLINARKGHAQQKKRVGEKAAYSDEPQYLTLDRTTPRHGNRSFHVGHIDHTPLPLKTKDEHGKDTETTIWLTVLVDAFGRYVLAFYLSFDAPSHVACMMVMRDCVRRHGRVPRWIIVDQGSEFIGTYFEQLLGMLEIQKRERPGGKARFGSTVERLFGTTIEQFIENLLGATHDMNPRQVGKDVDPTRFAIWTFNLLWQELERYFREVYHRNVHSGLGASPDSVFAAGLHAGGERPHKRFAYDRSFLIITCPSTSKGEAKVQASGIKINYLYYRCPEMDMPGVRGKTVPVRYEPFDRGRAYAYINGRWCDCYSEYYAVFANFTDRQIRLCSQALILKGRITGQAVRINAANLAAFLRSIESKEYIMQQQLLDAESALVRHEINLAKDINRAPRDEAADQLSHNEPGSVASRFDDSECLEDF